MAGSSTSPNRCLASFIGRTGSLRRLQTRRVWGFTKNIALELAPHQIWVNAIAPGGIPTPGVEQAQAGAQLPEGVDMTTLLEAFLGRIPMGRMGEPDDIGKVALFLASDLSSYMTGSQIVVDGGVLLSREAAAAGQLGAGVPERTTELSPAVGVPDIGGPPPVRPPRPADRARSAFKMVIRSTTSWVAAPAMAGM